MNARAIQRRIIGEKWLKSFLMPNYTPVGWFECDVLELTKAGYFVEYEVKMTLSDFRADARKGDEPMTFGDPSWNRPGRNKHLELSAGDTRGPNRFYFVAPAGILRATIVPDWAGLIEATPNQWSPSKFSLVTVRKAPRLHDTKKDDLRRAAEVASYYRMTRMFLKDHENEQFAKDVPEGRGPEDQRPVV